MTLQLKIVSEHREIVGDDAVRVFSETGGTIGRSLQNDWILPDPDRYISGRHATIDFRGGIYYLLDTSSNGVYVNGDCEPLGKGNSQRLFDGDRLRFGDFEIVVSIDEGESIAVPLTETDISPLAHSASVVDTGSLRTGVQLLEEAEITGDDEFQATLFGGPMDNGTTELAVSRVKDSASVAQAAPSPESSATNELLDAFTRGLGIGRDVLDPATDLAELMENAGQVLRAFVEGTLELMNNRADLKSNFSLDQTAILPRENNPLKLSTDAGESLKRLLTSKDEAYLAPDDAVRQVCRDLLFHQEAFLRAMDSAFQQFARRFSPTVLEPEFRDSLSSNRFLRLFHGSKYWRLYRELYPILTATGDERFPQTYADEFIKAYEEAIAEFRRLGSTEHLKATVILDQNYLRPEKIPVPSNDDAFADSSYVVDEDSAQQANG